MKKNFAFVTEDGILRIREKREDAERLSVNDKIVETEIEPIEGGYPAWEVDGKVTGVIVYDEESMKVDAKEYYIKIIPELAELYKAVK